MNTTMKDFCTKATHITKNIVSKTKKVGNKMIDHLTPKHDYSDLTEDDANIMCKLDRAETINNICWFSLYIIYYLVIIAYCIKQAKDVDKIIDDIE